MNSNLLKFCLEKGILLDTEMLSLLDDFEEEQAKEIIEKISNLQEKVITKSVIYKNAEKVKELIDDEKVIQKLKIKFNLSLEISREVQKKEREESEEIQGKEFQKSELIILESLSEPAKKVEVRDFVNLFRKRYNLSKNILQGRSELENLTSISKIGNGRRGISIIGTVFEKRITKNKNLLLEVEDLSGKIRVLVNKDKKELFEKVKEILPDDIVGIKGFGDSEIIFASDVVYPDSMLPERKSLDIDENVVFISDLHIGSRNFLKNNFEKFIKWVNGDLGNKNQREKAKKVKYILITGDGVDGVGVFPGQDEELDVKDIINQYEILANYLKQIRKDIQIVLCPGQHDGVRVAEPQPAIEKEFGKPLHEIDNLSLVSNPCLLEIREGNKGIKILMYHGAAMNKMVDYIDSLRTSKTREHPSKVVKEVLKRRNLASLHSAVTYIPTEQDLLFIKETPDIITTADFHHTDMDYYNNILMICNSCWQAKTPFEEKVGHDPDPCKVPVLNLKSREVKILDFSGEFEK